MSGAQSLNTITFSISRAGSKDLRLPTRDESWQRVSLDKLRAISQTKEIAPPTTDASLSSHRHRTDQSKIRQPKSKTRGIGEKARRAASHTHPSPTARAQRSHAR